MQEENNNSQIYFYEPRFYMLSNFSAFAFVWKGRTWMTAEHAYQAAKFEDSEVFEQIYKALSPYAAKSIATENRVLHHTDWSEVKLEIMKDVLRAKLEQHPYIKEKLIESGARELVENSPYDDFWGSGANGDGKNYLGKLWMELRAELKKK